MTPQEETKVSKGICCVNIWMLLAWANATNRKMVTLSFLEKVTVTLEVLVQDLIGVQSDDLSGRWYKDRWVCTWRRPMSSF